MSEEAARALARRLRRQARGCGALGSPLYQHLLERLAADCEALGPTWDALRGHEADPPGSVPALRLMGAVHLLVLSGRAPELARHYPSSGGDGDVRAAWRELHALIAARGGELRPLLEHGVQTNEVARAGPLLGGFLAVARAGGLPLRLLEVGASAGLLLRFDRYRYRFCGGAWGEPASPVEIDVDGPPPLGLDAPLRVVERRGCDLEPRDPASPEDRMRLLAYVWADQSARIERLRAALEIAAATPATVARADAAAWLEAELATPAAGAATVVYHSIVLQYLPAERVRRLERVLAEAGERATASAPLAWLRLEPAGPEAEVRLTLWPSGGERVVARCGYHGTPVRWHAEAA